MLASAFTESVGTFSSSLKKEAFHKQQTESQVKDCLHALEPILYIFIRNVTVTAEVAQIFGPGAGAFPLSAFSFYQFPFIYDSCM